MVEAGGGGGADDDEAEFMRSLLAGKQGDEAGDLKGWEDGQGGGEDGGLGDRRPLPGQVSVGFEEERRQDEEEEKEGVGIVPREDLEMQDALGIADEPAKRKPKKKPAGKQIEWIMAKPKKPYSPPARPHTSEGRLPSGGSSLHSVMTWRDQSGRAATGRRSAESLALKQAEWDAARRRDWISQTPLSNKPNPPRAVWGTARRPFQKPTQPDLKKGVSSIGLSWDDTGALNVTRRLVSPAHVFRTAERMGALTREQLRNAVEMPGPDACQPDVNAMMVHKDRGIGFTTGTREVPVAVSVSRRSGSVVATYGASHVSDESGCLYSGFTRQPLAGHRSSSSAKFGTSKRRGMATKNSGPGPADYAVRLDTSSKKDCCYRTKLHTSPAHLLPKTKRPWQTIDERKTFPMSVADLPGVGQQQVLTRNLTAPRAMFGRGSRHGTHAEFDWRHTTPGPGEYSS